MKFIIDIPESEFKADIDDVISREPFTNLTICEGFSCDECSFNRKDKGGCILKERVMNLPSAKPQERKIEKWIFHEKSVSTGFKDLRECSCCRCYFRWEMPRNSYCPNCGAKMESEG